MTRYAVEYTRAAARQLAKLDRPTRVRLLDAIDDLGVDPRPPGCRKLTGEDAWRVRVGPYRVIYEIADEQLLVSVIRAGHRRDIYR